MTLRSLFLAATLAAGALGAMPAIAQPANITAAVNDAARPASDKMRDADRKPAAMLAFAGIKPGDKVLELLAFGGYYTRILSKAVGPNGHVYATMPEEFLKMKPAAADGLKAIAADPAYANVTLLIQPMGATAAPVPVDVVWTSDNYHDLHNPGPFGADIATFNKAMFAALKPGGSYVIIDHASAKGTGTTVTGTLHRIDPDAVNVEVKKVGFSFAGQSDALHHTGEDYTAHASDKAEQLVVRFRKP